MGIGDPLEAAYRLPATIPGGRWGLVGDGLIFESCDVRFDVLWQRGTSEMPIVSFSHHFDAPPDGPTQKQTQYYEMLGTRGIWHEGWKAVTEHGPFTGLGHFDTERWQLFHTDVDRSEAHDVPCPIAHVSGQRWPWLRGLRTHVTRKYPSGRR